MYWDDYWQMYTDGSGNYYNADMTYAGYEDPETGGWWPGDYMGNGDTGGGNGGGNGGGPTYGWDPTEPDLTLPDWTPPGDLDPGFSWQGPIQDVEKESGGIWDRVKTVLATIGKGALSVLSNIKISGSGGSGAGGGGPTVAVPGRGTYDLYTGQRLPEPASIEGYLPLILIGGVALFFLSRRGRK
jgi:hypothetical protein